MLPVASLCLSLVLRVTLACANEVCQIPKLKADIIVQLSKVPVGHQLMQLFFQKTFYLCTMTGAPWRLNRQQCYHYANVLGFC